MTQPAAAPAPRATGTTGTTTASAAGTSATTGTTSAGEPSSAASSARGPWSTAGRPATSGQGGVPETKGSTTPRTLRRWRAATTAACVFTGAVAAGLIDTTGGVAPGSPADQIAHVAEARGRLEAADAEAAGALAQARLGAPPQDRAIFDQKTQEATGLLTRAAGAGEAEALTGVNTAVTGYARQVERAYAQVGTNPTAAAATYRAASDTLHGQTIPALAQVAVRAEDRLNRKPTGGGSPWGILVGGATLALLLGGSAVLARRTHRLVNPGLAGATLLVAGVTLAPLTSSIPALDLSRANELIGARTEAYAARRAEALRFLPGGTAATQDSAWTRDSVNVERVLRSLSLQNSAAGTAWATYDDRHTALVDATTPATQASGLAAAVTAGRAATEALDDEVDSAIQETDLGGFQDILALLGSLAAAVLAWAGFSRRIQEYR